MEGKGKKRKVKKNYCKDRLEDPRCYKPVIELAKLILEKTP